MTHRQVFEPESRGSRRVFEPAAVRNDFSRILSDPSLMASVLSDYPKQDLQRMMDEEIKGMDEQTKRAMMRKAGSVDNFLKAVMFGVATRLVAKKVADTYGPAALAALGIGTTGVAVTSGARFLASLSPEQLEMWQPFFDSSPLLQAMVSPDTHQAAAGVIGGIGDFLDWLSSLF